MPKIVITVWLFALLFTILALFLSNKSISDAPKIGAVFGLMVVGVIAVAQAIADIIYYYLNK